MARKLRIQYPGAVYHVMNRGDHREVIFCDEDDQGLFLATLGEGCQKTAWQVHSFCLMSNHFHLVIETPNANLVEGMKWLLGVYTSRFNRRHKLFGHLFKVRLAARLRAETTVTVNWIAHRLAMGTQGHLEHLLSRNPRAGAGLPLPSQPSLNI